MSQIQQIGNLSPLISGIRQQLTHHQDNQQTHNSDENPQHSSPAPMSQIQQVENLSPGYLPAGSSNSSGSLSVSNGLSGSGIGRLEMT